MTPRCSVNSALVCAKDNNSKQLYHIYSYSNIYTPENHMLNRKIIEQSINKHNYSVTNNCVKKN